MAELGLILPPTCCSGPPAVLFAALAGSGNCCEPVSVERASRRSRLP